MPKIDTRITIVLGNELYKAVMLNAVASDHTPSQEIRARLAASYGLSAPELPPGNPDPISALKLANERNPKHRKA